MTDQSATSIDGLLTGSVAEWASALPAYQTYIVTEMLKSQEPSQVALAWLASSGPSDTVPFGGIKVAANTFYANVLKEIEKLLCSQEGYEQERQALSSAGSTSKLLLVGLVSTAIAPHVGMAAVVVGPAVAMIFAILSNSVAATICQGISAIIAEYPPNG